MTPKRRPIRKNLEEIVFAVHGNLAAVRLYTRTCEDLLGNLVRFADARLWRIVACRFVDGHAESARSRNVLRVPLCFASGRESLAARFVGSFRRLALLSSRVARRGLDCEQFGFEALERFANIAARHAFEVWRFRRACLVLPDARKQVCNVATTPVGVEVELYLYPTVTTCNA